MACDIYVSIVESWIIEDPQNDKLLNALNFKESWIIEDPQNDKLNALNFKDNIKKGTWVVSLKLNNEL